MFSFSNNILQCIVVFVAAFSDNSSHIPIYLPGLDLFEGDIMQVSNEQHLLSCNIFAG